MVYVNNIDILNIYEPDDDFDVGQESPKMSDIAYLCKRGQDKPGVPRQSALPHPPIHAFEGIEGR